MALSLQSRFWSKWKAWLSGLSLPLLTKTQMRHNYPDLFGSHRTPMHLGFLCSQDIVNYVCDRDETEWWIYKLHVPPLFSCMIKCLISFHLQYTTLLQISKRWPQSIKARVRPFWVQGPMWQRRLHFSEAGLGQRPDPFLKSW